MIFRINFRIKKITLLLLTLSLTISVTLGMGWRGIAQTQPQLSSPRPIITQTARIQIASQLVYTQMPDFPLENQYLNRRTGQVDPEDTLVSRAVRYHVLTKNRPPSLRFDWKMTLADYLNANDPIVEDRYPGTDILQPNPLRGDRLAIARLTPAQRDNLVNLLVAAYTPVAIEPAQIIFPDPAPTFSPTPTPTPSGLQLPQPGDAQFLRFSR